MSSLRNAVKRPVHKERAQPASRKKLGLLEKHKDYAQRAQDYHRKQTRLRGLREKAAFKNPDEFYFGMTKAKTKEGVHVLDNKQELSVDLAKTLKSQDLDYVNMKRTAEKRKVERLSSSLHFLDAQAPSEHTIFVDSEAEAKTFSAAAHFDTVPELVRRKSNRIRKRTLETAEIVVPEGGAALSRAKRARTKAFAELEQHMEREKQMDIARVHLELQKNLMGKGRKQKVKEAKGSKPAVYRWKRERKR